MPRDQSFVVLDGKASVIVGMRRAGKTSFCLQNLARDVAEGVEKNRVLYLNFENIRLAEFTWRDFTLIPEVYYGLYPENKDRVCTFVFDEIQRVDKWELFARTLLDEENVRLVLTGSSSKLLSAEIATSMRGRALTTEIFPFSFREFLRCHGVFREIPEVLGAGAIARLRKGIVDYFACGGFPEVQSVTPEIRESILQEYVESVIFRDVVERHGVSNVLVLRRLVAAILESVGQRFSVSKFSGALVSAGITCNRTEVSAMLDHLSDAFFVFKVPVYSRSVRVRQVNPVKLYAIDVGLVRAGVQDPSANRGALLENLVYLHLRRNGCEIAYGTAANGGEIDFIISRRHERRKLLVQVCWSLEDVKTRNRELAVFESVAEELREAEKIVVTWDDEGTVGEVKIVPVWRFLLSNP